MIFIMTNKSGLRRDIKNTKNIKTKTSKKRSCSSRDISSTDLGYYSSLYSNCEWDELIHTSERKDMDKLDHVVTYNIKEIKST